MEYKEILKISNEKFSDFLVVEKPFEKYGINRKRILIKRFIDRLGKYFIFAEINNIVIGTSTVNEMWVINYRINDNRYDFKLEPGKEIDIIEMSIDWFREALEVERQRSNYIKKYQNIKNNTISEIRDYKLNKVL